MTEIKPQGTYNQSDLWGYNSVATGITSGHFGSYLNPINRGVNSVITTMVADGDWTFNGVASDGKNLGGPEWGLLALGGDAVGQSNPGDTIEIFLQLGGDIPNDLLD